MVENLNQQPTNVTEGTNGQVQQPAQQPAQEPVKEKDFKSKVYTGLKVAGGFAGGALLMAAGYFIGKRGGDDDDATKPTDDVE